MLTPAKITINPLLPRRLSSGVNGATVVSVEKLPDFFMADGSEISAKPTICNLKPVIQMLQATEPVTAEHMLTTAIINKDEKREQLGLKN